MEIVRKILSNRFTAFIIIFFALVVCSILFFRPYILLTVGSDEACDLTVYYDNGAKEGYCFDDAHMSQTQLMSGGEQTVKVFVPRSGLNRLRLDFGNMPCNVAIYQMVIVPNCIQSYWYSAEEVLQAFPVLNDISQSRYEDGVVKYAVSGSDGFITVSDYMPKKTAEIRAELVMVKTILLACLSFCIVFGKSLFLFVKKTAGIFFPKYMRHYKFANRVLVVLLLELCTVFICPQYWLIGTLFSVMVGCSICFMVEYITERKDIYKEYAFIALACVIAQFPFYLSGFSYGDTYFNLMGGRTPEILMDLCIGMRRPFVAMTSFASLNITVGTSSILRIYLSAAQVAFALMLYRFVLEKSESKALALVLSILMCGSVIAADCIAYLAVYPIIFSLFLSVIAYLAWENAIKSIGENAYNTAIEYGALFAGSLYAAFCMYQIGTPVFFVALVISVLDRRTQDKGVIKKGLSAAVAYGVIAVVYLLSTSWLQTLYGISAMQSARSEIIHTLPEVVAKIRWFWADVLPQSVLRIGAAVLPGRFFKTNNLFYTIAFENANLQRALYVAVLAVIGFYFVLMLYRRQWQKVFGCLCAIPLSFYPFLILPESTVLTYYILPIVMLLAVYFFMGLREIMGCIGQAYGSTKGSCKVLLAAVAAVIAVNSAVYANNWVLFCRDSYQYMKMSIFSSELENIDRIHVLGQISPYVGGNPYVVEAVERILEEEGYDPNAFVITQTDTPYLINQISAQIAQTIEQTLSEKDYQHFISYYTYSEFYECYCLSYNQFTDEEKVFMSDCLTAVGLVPDKEDDGTLIISLSGFEKVHPF